MANHETPDAMTPKPLASAGAHAGQDYAPAPFRPGWYKLPGTVGGLRVAPIWAPSRALCPVGADRMEPQPVGAPAAFPAAVKRLEYRAGGSVWLTLEADAAAPGGPEAVAYLKALEHGAPMRLEGLEAVARYDASPQYAKGAPTLHRFSVNFIAPDADARRALAAWLGAPAPAPTRAARTGQRAGGFAVTIGAARL